MRPLITLLKNIAGLGGISNYLIQRQVILSSGFPTQELDL